MLYFTTQKTIIMKIRGLILHGLLSLILIISLFIRLGEGNLAIALFDQHPYYLNLPLYTLLIIIIIKYIVLIFMKKDKRITLKILTISEVILLLTTVIIYIESYPLSISFLILIGICILQAINVFCKSFQKTRQAFIISSILILFGLSAFSVWFWTVSRFEFKLNDDGQSYSIVSIESDIPTIRIPSTYKGLPVTKINSNYYIYQNIQEIIFEEDSNIETIEQTAFRCRNLRKITLPSSLQTIGDNAFSFCYQLEEVIIPIEVIYIGGWVFDCENGIIYCEAESKPDTWEVGWCYKAKEIIWGYGG